MTAGNILDEVSPLFTNVKNGVAVEENLDKLKWKLKTSTKEDLKFVATRFKADNLLGALNTENESQLSMTCDVLQLLFSGLPAEILLDDNYTTYIRRCLAHSHSSVKRLGLDELNRHVNDSKLLTLFSSNGEDELLLLVIDCLCDEDTAVGVRATKFIAQLGKNGAGRSLICQLHFAQKVIEMTRLSQTYQIRLNEIVHSRKGFVTSDWCGTLFYFQSPLWVKGTSPGVARVYAHRLPSCVISVCYLPKSGSYCSSCAACGSSADPEHICRYRPGWRTLEPIGPPVGYWDVMCWMSKTEPQSHLTGGF
ncbi:unnamed protein product [Nesidiocoris tenuis]|uniref:26S proteasome non-ATPase regulatory subunit 5 n=1 Tax=Nesidiocoris tenuis TaxID=355587 RepID=A0A6H5H0E1_9HEMI|nr:unnamed protein product [Nesidiocoris tenuis]